MNSKTYDILKYVAQIALPAIATFVYALSEIWGIPNADAIVGTISAVDVLMGALLMADARKYNKQKEDELTE